MSIIIFLIVLAALVFVHELGHFLAAKKSGIRVDEFGLGFPPKLWSKKVGETEYSLNLIPFGGFVKIFGENPDEESISGPESARSFVNKPRPIQAIVLVAGIVFNFLFAWLLISFSFMIGVAASFADYSQYASRIENVALTVTHVSPQSPAEAAGIKAGDAITRVNDLTGEELTVEAVQDVISQSAGAPIELEYARKEETFSKIIEAKEGVVEDKLAIGIGMDRAGILSLPIHLALWEGGKLTIYMIKAVAVGLYDFIMSAFVGDADFSDVSGPVGIVGLVGDATRLGFTYLLMFTAIISINLGVINLVPFPALDGGRLLFVLIESIKRGPINPRIANTINAVGFALLLLLMFVVTYKDITKLFVN